jgi:hypothetical protein
LILALRLRLALALSPLINDMSPPRVLPLRRLTPAHCIVAAADDLQFLTPDAGIGHGAHRKLPPTQAQTVANPATGPQI